MKSFYFIANQKHLYLTRNLIICCMKLISYLAHHIYVIYKTFYKPLRQTGELVKLCGYHMNSVSQKQK